MTKTASGRAGAKGRVESWLSAAVVFVCYTTVLAVCRLCPRSTRPRPRSGRIVVVGTFHNPGWFVSHATPLGRARFREVIVLSHGELPAVSGVRVVVPPRLLTSIAGRTISKLVWSIVTGLRVDADLFMGYHLIPNSTIALLAGRLLGRPVCYQMTSGPLEVVGGGFGTSENPILRRLGRPFALLERLALSVIEKFDLVVVRGRDAERFAKEHAGARRVAIIPGSVNVEEFTGASGDREYDMVFVGQLVSRKQPLQFVEIAAAVARTRPSLRAAILGDGPMMPDVQRAIAAHGLGATIDVLGRTADVKRYLTRSKIFVLTSRSEGLSIAMAEAMIAGAVPIVSDVGDLRDLVVNDETGYLIQLDDTTEFSRRVASVLGDAGLWRTLSSNASRAARDNNGLDHVSAAWTRHLAAVIDPQSLQHVDGAADPVGSSVEGA
jgi:glycosyltransferase involved in cell wall biosynthesis